MTMNRRPYSVSTSSKDYPKAQSLLLNEFKGICDNQNVVSIDQNTFADSENIFVDEQGVLVSRPPFKFTDNQTGIVDEWKFGAHIIRLYRKLMTIYHTGDDIGYPAKPDGWTTGDVWPSNLSLYKPRGWNRGQAWPFPDLPEDNTEIEVTNTTNYNQEDLFFRFTFECISHETVTMTLNGYNTYEKYSWDIPVSVIGWDTLPDVKCIQIEDKIFVWFGGLNLIALNTTGYEGKLYFEDAVKYLYTPICKLVVNGIENDVETKNFLTDSYIRRYQYFSEGTINFEKLIGKKLSVNLNGRQTENTSQHLYDIECAQNQQLALIYPYSQVGNDYHFDAVQTARGNVIMRYSLSLSTIEVSYDGRSFRMLPMLDDIVGNPQLTRDGMDVVAFTRIGLANCKLVATEATEYNVDFALYWTIRAYAKGATYYAPDPSTVVLTDGMPNVHFSFIPQGYFESMELYSYVFRAVNYTSYGSYPTSMLYLYSHYSTGTYTYDTVVCLAGTDAAAPPAMSAYNYFVGQVSLHCSILTDSDGNDRVGISIFGLDYSAVPRLCIADLVYSAGELISSLRIYSPMSYAVKISVNDISNNKAHYFPSVINHSAIKCLYTNNTGETLQIKLAFKARFNCDYVASYLDEYDVGDYAYINDILYYKGTSSWIVAPPATVDYVPQNTEMSAVYDVLLDNVTITRTVTYGELNTNITNYKIADDSLNVITNTGIYTKDAKVSIPETGPLSLKITDTERAVCNNDNLVIYEYGTDDVLESRNIHKVTPDGLELSPGAIRSGDLVTFIKDADSIRDYLKKETYGNRFYIEKLKLDGTTNWAIEAGEIKLGDLIRLRAYPNAIVLPTAHVSNGTGSDITIAAYLYPVAPVGWTTGNPWPDTFPQNAIPLYPTTNKTVRPWGVTDSLPTGSVMFYGTVGINKKIIPLCGNASGIYTLIDGTLWTSQPTDNNILELDEYVNVNYVNDKPQAILKQEIPEHHAKLNQDYFSFSTTDGRHLLEINIDKRDENALIDDRNNLLLYLPKLNEQVFANHITNLHPLSTTEMGVFTNDEIWYVGQLNSDSVVYKRAVKSKLPCGCREGDDVVTALDGRAIIFATPRGIAALAPEDFVSTTDQTITYLSDNILSKYYQFYYDNVTNLNQLSSGYVPNIKTVTYRYWMLFYKYMSRDVLLLDTRYNTWWSWKCPYPLRRLLVNDRLYAVMQVDYSPAVINDMIVPSEQVSKSGIEYILSDREFFKPTDTTYLDDIIPGTINGDVETIVQNEIVGDTIEISYATPIIPWQFTSQKLHLGALNNYKHIKEFLLYASGNDSFRIKLTTKVFRDFYKPEKMDIIDTVIDDIRTYVKRVNLMHVTNLQYTFENANVDKQLRFNSLCIKYEIKEALR